MIREQHYNNLEGKEFILPKAAGQEYKDMWNSLKSKIEQQIKELEIEQPSINEKGTIMAFGIENQVLAVVLKTGLEIVSAMMRDLEDKNDLY